MEIRSFPNTSGASSWYDFNLPGLKPGNGRSVVNSARLVLGRKFVAQGLQGLARECQRSTGAGMGEFSTWTTVAGWMAEMHAELTKVQVDAAEERAIHLIQYDREFYWRWMRRAQKFVGMGDTTVDRRSANAVDWLASRYETVVERLCALPLTVVHGEFFASNVLINPDPNDFRVCPVDWELAALAPGYIDVAALTAGGWSREQKEEMSLAYLAAMPECGLGQPDRADFLRDMDFCRLHYAVQWLGWSAGWKPPEEHAQDWLKEALRCAEILGL